MVPPIVPPIKVPIKKLKARLIKASCEIQFEYSNYRTK
jgi:hypothetical protein